MLTRRFCLSYCEYFLVSKNYSRQAGKAGTGLASLGLQWALGKLY